MKKITWEKVQRNEFVLGELAVGRRIGVNMTLYEAQKGSSYCIRGLYVEPVITRRLEALGLNDGTIINVLNRKKHGALIIRVRGTRLALGKHISSNIEISEYQKEAAGAVDGCEGESVTSEKAEEDENEK